MILNALADYYGRKAAESASDMAPIGFQRKSIDFVVVLNAEGLPILIEDTRERQGKKLVGRRFLVPQEVKRAVNILANLLWDNAEYVFGVAIRNKPERVKMGHEAFLQRFDHELSECADAGLDAVRKFFANFDLTSLEGFSEWTAILEGATNISFKLQGDKGLVCERPRVAQAIAKRHAPEQSEEDESTDGAGIRICSVTGIRDSIARLHPAIKGVWGAQSSGANIVSFNLPAFTSFGKTQGFNAPIGKRTAFAYTTALNRLLDSESHQRIQVGDTSTVFWAERANPLEDDMADLLGGPAKDDADANTEKVRALFKAVEQGGYTPDDSRTRFFVLGLAPNAARLAIRFWQAGTVKEIATQIARHFTDLQMAHGPRDPDYPSVFQLLLSIAALRKAENIPPNLGGDLMRAILSGGPYPATLLQAAIRRSLVERTVTYYRAALIKACLNRQQRLSHPDEKEIAVTLDIGRADIGYRLGRLFAALEKIQEEAQPGINATIRDRFYGAASSSPVTVFSNLMKLKNHHLAKLEHEGRVRQFEKLIGDIMGSVRDFPATLPLVEQGRFAIGYYHQRQDFFIIKPKSEGE